jgi:hypothetical protein
MAHLIDVDHKEKGGQRFRSTSAQKVRMTTRPSTIVE